jgi:hypothetical protein
MGPFPKLYVVKFFDGLLRRHNLRRVGLRPTPTGSLVRQRSHLLSIRLSDRTPFSVI